jgi:predicted nucleic acid-binding protein
MLVADTNVLTGLFLPSPICQVVWACRETDDDWRLPTLWVPEFRHVLLKVLPRTMTVDSSMALQRAHEVGCSSSDAEFVVLAQQLACPLLTFDRTLLQLFPEVAVQPGA